MKQFSFIQRILMPLLFVGVLSILSTAAHMFSVDMERIKANALNEARELEDLLIMAESLVSEHVQLSMQILKQRSLDIGSPNIKGNIVLNNQQLADLKFGAQSQAFGTSLVDGVTDTGAGTATLFVKHQGEFVRIATSVRQKDGSRAIGTVLDPTGKAISYLLAKKPFYGVVDILGEPYISGYEPIIDQSGKLIGAWYVGYKVDVKALDQAIKKWAFLQSGFAAITDYNNNIRFLSERVTETQASKILSNPTDKWVIVTKNIPQWDFHAVMAYPAREAFWNSASKLYPLLIMGGLFGALLIVLALQSLRQFVIAPLGGDPQTATKLVSRIEQGDFEEDGTKAEPGTLIGNMLKMRQRLREMLNELQQNAERLSVSSSVFAHAHDGIFITDANANIVEVNYAFTQITGYPREDALGRVPQALGFVTYDDSLLDLLWLQAESNSEWRGETWNRRMDGDVYAAWLDIFCVRDEANQIKNFVGLFSDITQAKEQQQNLERMAYHDPLTQLPNRALLSDRLQQALARAERSGELLAVCCLDLDGFKPVNDTLGHEAGDYLLVQLAVRMSACLRDSDTVARLGGDEFAVLLCGLQSVDECTQTLERLLNVIKTPYSIGDKSVTVSSSIGYTIFPDDGCEPDTLLRHADHAMYQAKLNGGSRVQQFDSHHDRQFRGLRQDRERVEAALPNNEFRLYYQPKVDLRQGKVVGMEALIRWEHPELGLRAPATFLPIVEDTDFSILLGEWVIREALGQIRVWQASGLDFQVSVNIAARHIVQSNFTDRLILLLTEFPEVKPDRIEFEITETAAIEDISGVANTINSCKQLGVSFALDDFGVGYSSLTYLRRLPVETIKIDQSFVRDMLQDVDDLAVVAGVISLSRDFKRKVVAEGVENSEQGVWLLHMGCSVVQGYGIARPMTADNVQDWVEAYQQDPSWTLGLI